MIYLSSNSTGDGRFTISVTFDIGTNLDIAQVQVQNRVAIAQPRLPADVRNIGVTVQQELARPDDGRASLFAGQVARHAVHFQLRDARDQRRADPRRRRRLAHRVRQPRLRDARLARSRPAAIARPDRERRGDGAAGPERAGRLRRAQPAAGRQAGRVPDFGADARPPRRSGRVRQYRRQADRERGRAGQGRRDGRTGGAGLFDQFLSRSRSGGRDRHFPAAGLERAGDRARQSRRRWRTCRSVSRPA